MHLIVLPQHREKKELLLHAFRNKVDDVVPSHKLIRILHLDCGIEIVFGLLLCEYFLSAPSGGHRALWALMPLLSFVFVFRLLLVWDVRLRIWVFGIYYSVLQLVVLTCLYSLLHKESGGNDGCTPS